MGSFMLFWCINKQHFPSFGCHCSHPYYLKTWFAASVIVSPIPELFDKSLILSFFLEL